MAEAMKHSKRAQGGGKRNIRLGEDDDSSSDDLVRDDGNRVADLSLPHASALGGNMYPSPNGAS